MLLWTRVYRYVFQSVLLSNSSRYIFRSRIAGPYDFKIFICLWWRKCSHIEDYTVEVRNRFKGLDLIECLMNYGWRFVTLYRGQGSRPSPRKRNAKKQNGCLRRPYKKLWKKKGSEKERRKGKIFPSECGVPKNSKEIRKPSLVINAKK